MRKTPSRRLSSTLATTRAPPVENGLESTADAAKRRTNGTISGTSTPNDARGRVLGVALDAVRARPDRLRATVVIGQREPRAALDALGGPHTAGARGIRLNLVGAPPVPLGRAAA
ncbi:hypothetical protein E1265_01805 [Streptomyces sp. 8K308]|uniref:hypothetical protein n=1 Tax=Streptomyces sp. 8K308 TaxID=2530388 RepID=UPI00104C6EBC|nr:hypothetical protein [Streptomyces sp. 8K308]TDC27443.1 hypothetical protein E1265_01805 [Streptomyces sp. 8K308]